MPLWIHWLELGLQVFGSDLEPDADLFVVVCLLLCVQLFDAMSLEDVYPPLKPAALYEEALCLVREDKVAYRSLR